MRILIAIRSIISNNAEMLRLSRAQVRAVDRIAIEEYGIPGIVLMENAARSAVDAIRARFPITEMAVGILCGPGNNGGDGYAIARHLANLGSPHTSLFESDVKPRGDGGVNHQIAVKMGLEREPI